MTQRDFAWYVFVCAWVWVVAGTVVCGSHITMETAALSWREDIDARVSNSTGNRKEQHDKNKIHRATRLTSGFISNKPFAANFTVFTVYAFIKIPTLMHWTTKSMFTPRLSHMCWDWHKPNETAAQAAGMAPPLPPSLERRVSVGEKRWLDGLGLFEAAK